MKDEVRSTKMNSNADSVQLHSSPFTLQPSTFCVRATYEKEEALVVRDQKVIPLRLRRKSGAVARDGLFEELADLLVTLVRGFESGAQHPLVKRTLAALERLAGDFESALLEHFKERGQPQRLRVRRVADDFDPVVELEFRVTLGAQGVDDRQAPHGLHHPDHFLERKLRLRHMVD